MPQLGEIKRGREINKRTDRGSRKYIWVACQSCGRARWVQLRQNKPKNELCLSCAKWKGGQYKCKSSGYVFIKSPSHPPLIPK